MVRRFAFLAVAVLAIGAAYALTSLQTVAAVSPPPNSGGPKTPSNGACLRTAVPAAGQAGTFVLNGNNLGGATVSSVSPVSFKLDAVGTPAPNKTYVAPNATFTGIVGNCSVQWTFLNPHVTLTHTSGSRPPGAWTTSYSFTSYDSVTSTAAAATPAP
jgi:hypothetical protein